MSSGQERVLNLNNKSIEGKSVLYVMSRDQRVQDNHSLAHAQKIAIEKSLPLAVLFDLKMMKGRAREHYDFMLSGLREVEAELEKLNIPFILSLDGGCDNQYQNVINSFEPALVVFDFSPFKRARSYQKILAADINCQAVVVDNHNVIPAWITSDKQEYAAHTIRTKIHLKISEWLNEAPEVVRHQVKWPGHYIQTSELQDLIDQFLEKIPKNNTILNFAAGTKAARQELTKFITDKLRYYAVSRNNPNEDATSNLSPYLHFGQISALRVIIELQKEALKHHQNIWILKSNKLPKGGRGDLLDGIDALIEELLVRKELSDNFVFYGPDPCKLSSAPVWALKTLESHQKDVREHLYSLEEFEEAKTHDTLWNAAQLQLRKSGKIHGYMRMYWAKKVLEWTTSPEEAMRILIQLNDFYSIDGLDPNGYVGILWSIAGLHDRPWFDRSVYGQIRYMSAGGLTKKFDTDQYIRDNQ